MTKKRLEHYKDLADSNALSLDVVVELANLLGEDEDYDGLVTMCQNLQGEDYEA